MHKNWSDVRTKLVMSALTGHGRTATGGDQETVIAAEPRFGGDPVTVS